MCDGGKEPCPCEGLREKAIAEFIDNHGINCDCCGHVMIDVTSAQTEEKQHCVAGDSEGEGVGCARSWHETVGHLEAERDQLCAELAEALEALKPFSDLAHYMETHPRLTFHDELCLKIAAAVLAKHAEAKRARVEGATEGVR